jgi:hypothetical protein
MSTVRAVATTELLVTAFDEVPDDGWAREMAEATQLFQDRLKSYPRGPIEGAVSLKNIGRGADWVVVAVTIASAAGTAFFAIPKAHRAIRESISEWARILKELKSLYAWITGNRQTFYPDQYLFLLALEHLDKAGDVDALVYLGLKRLPEDVPDLQGLEPLLLSFASTNALEQVAVSRQGKVLWHNQIPTGSTLRASPLLLRKGIKRKAIASGATARPRARR